MSEEMGKRLVNRRDVLRSGAAVGGGLLATAVAGGSVAAQENDGQTGVVGYISRSSYRKLTGSDDVDCVPNADGWGGTFYVRRVAEDGGGDTGVSVEVPDPSDSGGYERCEAYTVTADETVELSGGPSGHGPWKDACGSWVFLTGDATLETASVYRVSNVSSTEPLDADYEDVTATDSDGDELGSPMDLMRVSIERAAPAKQWTRSRKFTSCGSAVAVDGTTALLGPGYGGTACVLNRTEDSWTQETTLGETDDAGPDPATDGETLLLAGPPEGDTSNSSVLVYSKTDGRWEKQATLLPDDLDDDADFGRAHDVDGNTIVVGAPGDPGTNERSEGAVYVYRHDGGDWTLEATLEDTRDSTDTADGLGYDVAVDGDTILAGAPYAIYYDFGFSSVGGGLVFTRSDGEWSQGAFLRSDNPNNEDFQGYSVALEGDTAVLASPRAKKDSEVTRNAGVAWVFTRDGSAWSQQARVTPDDWESGDWFAADIALDGDRLLVGSNTRDSRANDAEGAAYIFRRDGTAWHQVVKLTPDDGEARDQFGSSVALDGAFAFIGARSDENPDSSRGSVYIFER